MNLFLISRLKLIILIDSLSKNVQQFPQIAPGNLETNETVTAINFHEQLITKLIVALNPNKAHVHGGLSISILKLGSDWDRMIKLGSLNISQ